MSLWIESQECICDPDDRADRKVVYYQGVRFCQWCRRRKPDGSSLPTSDPARASLPRLADHGNSDAMNELGRWAEKDGGATTVSDQYNAARREMQSLVDTISDAFDGGNVSRADIALTEASAEARMMFWLNSVTVMMGLRPDSPEAIQEQVSHLMNGGHATLRELRADIESMSVEGQEHAVFLLTHHPAAGVRQIGGVIEATVGRSGASLPATPTQTTPGKPSAYDDLPPPTVLATGRTSTSGRPPASSLDAVGGAGAARAHDPNPTPSSRELTQLRNNVLAALDNDSRLVELGQVAQSYMGADASQFSLAEKGAVAFISMLDIYFSYAQDRELYQTALGRVNVFVDRESNMGGRAWWLVRDHLLEIGRQRGWSSLDTLYEDWTPVQRKQFNNMLAQEAKQQGKKGGCYVATAVYGSYDCPEVWVLRRWRDKQLASTTVGRQFIRLYYRVSPTVVSTVGNERWFTRAVRRPLDRFVARLLAAGYSSLPYSDEESSS